MNNGLRMTRLGDVCDFSRGLTYSKTDEVEMSRNVVLRANNIDVVTGRLDLSDLRYINDKIDIPEAKRVQEGSLLVCTASGSKKHLGKVALIPENIGYAFGGFMGLLRPRESISSRYLHYVLSSELYTAFIEALSSGVNINNLKFSQLAEFEFPLHSHAEQERIVAILDEAFAGIDAAVANAEKNVTNARELFDSYRDSVFTVNGAGWVQMRFAEVATIKHGFPFQSSYFGEYGPYVLMTPGNFYEAGGYRDRGRKQKFYDGPVPEGYVLRKGDMLLAMTEQAAGLLGSPAIVPEDELFLHNQRLGLVVPHEGTPWYNRLFFHAFNTAAFRQKVHDGASGVKVRHTSPKKLGEVTIAFPESVAEQVRVANRLDECLQQTRELEAVFRQKLTVLTELKQSILQKAFAGELTAKVAEREMAAA